MIHLPILGGKRENKMNTETLNQHRVNQSDPFYAARFRAIITALTESDLYSIASDEFFKAEQDVELTSQVAASIAFRQHIEPTDHYDQLIKLLAGTVRDSSKFRTKQKYALLIELLATGNTNNQQIINATKVFTTTDYVNIRKIGYRVTEADLEHLVLYENIVENAYKRFGDYNCLRIVVRKLPQICERNLSDLTEDCGGVLLKDLYLSVELDASKLDMLKNADSITYLYVAAVRGVAVDATEAERIWTENIDDSRWAIMLYALGKLKLLDVILDLSEPSFPRDGHAWATYN